MRAFIPVAMRFTPTLLLQAQGIKVLFLDVDGVFTDGGIFLQDSADPRGAAETIKRFNTLDGLGLKLLQKAGITPVVISGRDSRALRMRLEDLGVARAHFGIEHKLQVATRELVELGHDWTEAAAMGDDWPDLSVMRRCALACAPPNAHPEVCALADYLTTTRGGDGAVREMTDLLLIASGRYAALLEEAAS